MKVWRQSPILKSPAGPVLQLTIIFYPCLQAPRKLHLSRADWETTSCRSSRPRQSVWRRTRRRVISGPYYGPTSPSLSPPTPIWGSNVPIAEWKLPTFGSMSTWYIWRYNGLGLPESNYRGPILMCVRLFCHFHLTMIHARFQRFSGIAFQMRRLFPPRADFSSNGATLQRRGSSPGKALWNRRSQVGIGVSLAHSK